MPSSAACSQGHQEAVVLHSGGVSVYPGPGRDKRQRLEMWVQPCGLPQHRRVKFLGLL